MIYVVVGVSAAFFLSWLLGSMLNRRRAAKLVQTVREALPALGQGANIRWFGAGAFQIDLGQPAPELTRVQVVGLLEARDLAFVWLYWRLRGRRDRLVVQADFRRPPKAKSPEAAAAASTAAAAASVPGITSFTLQPSSPHLYLVQQVPAGREGSVALAFQLVRDLAGGKAAVV
ncbi:MAG: hypothetical protein ACYC5Y_14930 [Symbiobacteriia bacterium]